MAVSVYELTKSFPAEEKFGITSQMRRSGVSIPSNIAEGTARNSSKAFSNCLDIGLGESFELETQAIIANRVEILSDNQFSQFSNKVSEVQKMIIGFKTTVEANPY